MGLEESIEEMDRDLDKLAEFITGELLKIDVQTKQSLKHIKSMASTLGLFMDELKELKERVGGLETYAEAETQSGKSH